MTLIYDKNDAEASRTPPAWTWRKWASIAIANCRAERARAAQLEADLQAREERAKEREVVQCG